MNLPDMDLVLSVFSKEMYDSDIAVGNVDDVNRLLDFAHKQGCFYVVANYLLNNIDLPEDFKSLLKERVEAGKYTSFAKYIFLINLLKKLEKNGIKAVVLKGYSVARFFKNPFLRISGDIDLLVDCDNEKAAKKILEKTNFKLIHKRKPHEHHSSYKHPVYGMLELHVKLFEDEISNVWFADSASPLYVEIKTKKTELNNQTFRVLDDEAQLLHIFFHLAKHFVENGISVRMMFDFALSCKEFKDTVDFEKVRSIIEKSGFIKLYNSIFSFLIKYCGFKEKDLPAFTKTEDSFADALYSDLVNGGWLGLFNTTSGEVLNNFTSQKVNKIKANQDELFRNRKGFVYYLSALFPSPKKIIKMYSYSEKRPLLFPVALINRYIDILKRKTDKSLKEKLNIRDKARFDLLKKFELLD